MGLHFLNLQVHGRFKCVHGHPNVELSMDKSPVVKTTASTSMDKSPLVKTTASTSTVHGQSPWTDHGQSRGPRPLNLLMISSVLKMGWIIVVCEECGKTKQGVVLLAKWPLFDCPPL